jgi:hypothetical protein
VSAAWKDCPHCNGVGMDGTEDTSCWSREERLTRWVCPCVAAYRAGVLAGLGRASEIARSIPIDSTSENDLGIMRFARCAIADTIAKEAADAR